MLNATQVASDVTIAFSWPSWWATELGSRPSAGVRMREQLRWLYRPVSEAGATAGFVQPGAELSGYLLVLVPSLYLLTEAEAGGLGSFVRSGGTAVITFWSGIVNEPDQIYPGSYGGPLRELFGGWCPTWPRCSPRRRWSWPGRTGSGTATLWQDIIEPGEGQVRARFAAGPWAGRPAGLGYRYGAGRVIYLGTRPDGPAMRELIGAQLGRPAAVPGWSGWSARPARCATSSCSTTPGTRSGGRPRRAARTCSPGRPSAGSWTCRRRAWPSSAAQASRAAPRAACRRPGSRARCTRPSRARPRKRHCCRW
ncbi:MAG TPA: beta-galactosidase trimerization domain-containing protein [Streptosporangiaceae bacterium]|nr:beta-galactosidase trimerization domain-containing protein [Streptosporangiaceae bacterium]